MKIYENQSKTNIYVFRTKKSTQQQIQKLSQMISTADAIRLEFTA